MKNQKFTIEGFYTHNGRKENFEGDLLYIPKNNKLVGIIIDEITEYEDKLVVGFLEGNRIQFWKIQPFYTTSYPIIYTATGTVETEFKGYWDAYNNLEDYITMLNKIPQITEAFRMDSTENQIKELQTISNESLTPYFLPGLMQAISKYGQENGNYTEFKLKKLK